MNRRQVIDQVIKECINEMYTRAQPSITYDELVKLYKEQPDKQWYEYFYLSHEEYKDIQEDYIAAYRIRNEFHDDVKLVKDYLEKGGTKDKYIYPKDGSPGYRSYEKTPKLKDVIGEEHTKIVLDLIEECNNFYNPTTEESNFIFNVSNYAPCSNISTVRDNRPDMTIYERKYDEDWDKWRNIDSDGKFIYGPLEEDEMDD